EVGEGGVAPERPRGQEPVERPEERRQRLARAGRRGDQRIGAGGDRGPSRLLCRRRRAEARFEPAANQRRERHGGTPTPHPRLLLAPRGGTRQRRCFPPPPRARDRVGVWRKTGRSRARTQSTDTGRTPAAPARAKPRATPPPRTVTASRPVTFRLARWTVWGVATLAFFVATAIALERQITWYLAVDQFGYLRFAHDLLSGRVFHDWPPLHALQQHLPPRTDVLAQTYVDDGGRLYCRYSPGFPMLLAAWIAIFGDLGAHYLNATLYLVLLAIALAFQWRLFRSPWRAGAGTVLIALFPTLMHLWGLTLTRDISAHVFAFAGLFLLLPARGRALGAPRLLVASGALGFAVSIRPDAVLYLVPTSLMVAHRWLHERRRGWDCAQ